MKKIFLFVLSVVLLSQLALAEDSPWYVSFYQDPNAGGLSAKLDVSPVGTAIPIDEFAKYHLEGGNGMSEIRYKLPQGVALVCFTRRFFKSTDADIANFINNLHIIKTADPDQYKAINSLGSKSLGASTPINWTYLPDDRI